MGRGRSLLRSVRPFLRTAADYLLSPAVCFVCHRRLPEDAPRRGVRLERWLCPSCVEDLPLLDAARCEICGEGFEGNLEHSFRCWNCDGRSLEFEFAVSTYAAHDAIRDLVHQFKYGRDYKLRGLLSAMLGETLLNPRIQQLPALKDWFLVPVPLHFWRELRREYNQSWLIAQSLAKQHGMTALNLLCRSEYTTPQAGLDRRKRLTNLQSAFAPRKSRFWSPQPDCRGKNVLLVDDVLTTGTTAHECARVLKKDLGIEKVVVITIARG